MDTRPQAAKSLIETQSHFDVSNAHLDKMRKTGDEPADELVLQLVNMHGSAIFKELQPYLTNFVEPIIACPSFEVADFITANSELPEWADKQQISEAYTLYNKYALDILIMLGCLSLPYCYAAADGARVLYYTGRLRKDTYNRLLETGQFVAMVTSKGALDNALVRENIVKVRLLHAFTRYYLTNHGNWNMDWGLPVNQEDMAGTNLAFSFIVTRGLRKVSIPIKQAESEAYLHLWNVVSHLMGCDDSLIPRTLEQAWQLDKAIARRHFKASEEGAALAKALEDSMSSNVVDPRVRSFGPKYMRYLLGPEIAAMLSLKESGASWPVYILKGVNYLRYTLKIPIPLPQPPSSTKLV